MTQQQNLNHEQRCASGAERAMPDDGRPALWFPCRPHGRSGAARHSVTGASMSLFQSPPPLAGSEFPDASARIGILVCEHLSHATGETGWTSNNSLPLRQGRWSPLSGCGNTFFPSPIHDLSDIVSRSRSLPRTGLGSFQACCRYQRPSPGGVLRVHRTVTSAEAPT